MRMRSPFGNCARIQGSHPCSSMRAKYLTLKSLPDGDFPLERVRLTIRHTTEGRKGPDFSLDFQSFRSDELSMSADENRELPSISECRSRTRSSKSTAVEFLIIYF